MTHLLIFNCFCLFVLLTLPGLGNSGGGRGKENGTTLYDLISSGFQSVVRQIQPFSDSWTPQHSHAITLAFYIFLGVDFLGKVTKREGSNCEII